MKIKWEDEITQLSNTSQQVDLATVFLFCNQSILLCNSDDSRRGGGGGGGGVGGVLSDKAPPPFPLIDKEVTNYYMYLTAQLLFLAIYIRLWGSLQRSPTPPSCSVKLPLSPPPPPPFRNSCIHPWMWCENH